MMENIPEWLNNNFFMECLQKETGNQDIVVTNISVSSAAPPGNNYGSLTARVKVEYKNSKTDEELHVKSLIVKAESTDEAIQEVIAGLKFIEPTFYYQFILKAKNYTDTFFVPECIYSPRPDVTVLEDLKDKGFVMADRLKQLDFNHCRLYMIAAASMHAVSVPVFKEFPAIKDAVGEEKMFKVDGKSRIMILGMIKGGMKCLVEAMDKIERFKKYTTVIEHTSPHLYQMLVDAHKPSEVLNTLNQGDPWTTNMMFKYNDKGVVSEIKLLDFQGLRYGSPVNDVMYFIWSSANNEVKKHKLKELYHIYLETLNKKLEEFNCVERLTYEQLIDNVRKLSPVTLLFVACNLPLLCYPHPLNMADFIPKGDEVLDTTAVFKRYFNENFCTNYLPSLLESLEEKMDSSLPEWVNKDFFQQCLRKEENNDTIIVTNLTVSSAVPPGNNYGSFIIRVALDWKFNKNDMEFQSSKFIVKAELTEGPMKDMTTEFALNEPSFYYKFIPRAKQFTDITFAAKSFFSPKPSVTVLEDLKENGFVMADRTKQLDFDHCHLYMTAAASFHSVSVPVFKNYPELLEPINKEVMYSNESKIKDMFKKMIDGGMKKFVEEIEKVDRYKKYAKTMKDITPHLWDMLVEAHKPSEVVNTIKQGDPWVTNMMFKYNKEGKVCDVKIIDFQGTGYGSPIADLMMFLWSSANNDVKKNNLDELFRIYLESFNENLKQFNCSERLTYQQMMEHVQKLNPVALFIMASFVPGLVNSEVMDLNVFLNKDSDSEVDKFYDKYYTEDYCLSFLPQVFETLEVNGVFTYLENYKK